MRLKDFRPKYEDLEIYIDKENYSLFEIPQKMKYSFALSMYSERKILFSKDHDDKKTTEIMFESDEQFKKRQKFEN